MFDKIMKQAKSCVAVRKLCIFLTAFVLTAAVMGGNHDIFYGSKGVSETDRFRAAQDTGMESQSVAEIAGDTALAAVKAAKLEESKTETAVEKDSVKVRSKPEDEENADAEASADEAKSKAKGKTIIKPMSNANNEAIVKTTSKTTDKTTSKTTDKTTSKTTDKTADKATDKATVKTTDKTADKAVVKTVDKTTDKTAKTKKAKSKDGEAVTVKTADYKGLGYRYSPKIPMSAEHQEYTYKKCVEHGLEYELVLAIIWRESRFTPNAVNVNTNGTRDNGYMQINDVNRKWLREHYGITDLMDPYQNIAAGTAMLGSLTKKYGAHNALLAYQYGEGGMAVRLKRGITTSEATESAYRQRDYYRQVI